MAAFAHACKIPLALLVVLVPPSGPARAQKAQPAGFVDASTLVEGLVVDMRYFGEDNFVGTRIDGYEHPRCLLTREAASALASIQRDLSARGFGLKVFDCYRPARAITNFVRWAHDLADVKRKRDFYPEVDKRDLFRLGYIARRSGHSRGSTVDLTLVRSADRQEIDMGTPFDLFSPRSSAGDKTVSAQQRVHRMELREAMRRRGFMPFNKEWWHFTLANEPFPNTYFNFLVR